MNYVVLVTTYIRSENENDTRLQSYKRTFNAWSYKRAKQLETDLTFSSETALDRAAWQEAYICVSVRIGRQGERVLIPLNEAKDLAEELNEAWDMAMEEKLGPLREPHLAKMPVPPTKYEDEDNE
jgi:hypothetical protein